MTSHVLYRCLVCAVLNVRLKARKSGSSLGRDVTFVGHHVDID